MLPTLVRRASPSRGPGRRGAAEDTASAAASVSGASHMSVSPPRGRVAAGDDEDMTRNALAQGDVFHTIDLDSADRRPEYIYFDSISFPRVTRDIPMMNPKAELDNLWMVGVLHQEEASGPTGPSAAQVAEYERRFGIRRSKEADAKALKRRLREQTKKEEGDKFLTKEERKRLHDLEMEFKRELHEAAHGPRSDREKRDQKLQTSAYAVENRKLRKVLQLRGTAGRRQLELFGSTAKRKVVKSVALENLAYLDRLEQQAAVVIQRAFRRFHRILFWKKWLRATKAAVTIQRAARGYIIRRLVREWVRQRESLVTKAQAIIRGKLARDNVQREQHFLSAAATDIQRTFRGFLWRLTSREDRDHRAATRIQAAWRGVRARAKADRLFLDDHAMVIQTAVRGWLQRRRFRVEYAEKMSAATRVQALFRSYMARVQRNELLWERETQNRKSWMEILRTEQHWLDKEIEKRLKTRAKENLESQIEAAEMSWRKLCDQVALYEFDFVSLSNERAKLSPRAIEQGWAVQLRSDVEQHREWVSQYKAKALFEAGIRHRSLQRRKQLADRVMAEMLAGRRECEARWVDERNSLWRRLNERRWAEERLLLTKRAADEKRRWRITHYTESGKPDLVKTDYLQSIRNGDSSLETTRIFSMANSNLLALTPAAQFDAKAAQNATQDARIAALHATAHDPRYLTSGDYARGAAVSGLPARAVAGLLADAAGGGADPSRRLPALPAPSLPTVDEHGNFVGFPAGAPSSAAAGSRAVPVPSDGATFASLRGSSAAPPPPPMRSLPLVVEEIDEEQSVDAAAMHAQALDFVRGGGRGLDSPESSSWTLYEDQDAGAGPGDGQGAEMAAFAPHSQFAEEVARARRGEGRLPVFLRTGLIASKVGSTDEVNKTFQAQRDKMGDDAVVRDALASLPPGLLAARRAEAASAIARARVQGTVGTSSVTSTRADRREALEKEIAEFNQLGSRVQRLADTLGAISGAMEMQQYGALLKPIFSNMESLMTRLGAAPQQAAELAGHDADPYGPPPRLRARAEREAKRDARREQVATAAAAAGGASQRHATSPRSRADVGIYDVDPEDLPDEYKTRLGLRLESVKMGLRTRETGSRASPPSARLPSARSAASPLGGAAPSRNRPPSGRQQLAPLAHRPNAGLRVGFDTSVARDDGTLEATYVSDAPGDDSFVKAQRRARNRRKQYETVIPWSLLDELEAEKDKLLQEQRRGVPFDRARAASGAGEY